MVKIGIIRPEAFTTLVNMPGVFTDNWQSVTRGETEYLKIFAFQQYFTDEVISQMETVFNSEDDFNAWLASDMEYINRSWKSDYSDYKQARERIKEIIVNLGGFEALNEGEKRIAASWFAITADQLNSVFTLDEILAARPYYNEQSRDSRKRRYYLVYELFETALTTADAVKVMQKVKAYDLEDLYVKSGFEGGGAVNYKGDADPAAILDFINSTAAYAAAGLDSLNLQPLYGLSVADLKTRATSLIKYGTF